MVVVRPTEAIPMHLEKRQRRSGGTFVAFISTKTALVASAKSWLAPIQYGVPAFAGGTLGRPIIGPDFSTNGGLRRTHGPHLSPPQVGRVLFNLCDWNIRFLARRLLYLLDSIFVRRWNISRSHNESCEIGKQQLASRSRRSASAVFQTDLQVPVASKKRTVRHGKLQNDRKSGRKRNLSKRYTRRPRKSSLEDLTMPLIAVEPRSKTPIRFPYPPSGKARVIVKSNQPIDVFISDPTTANQINSLQAAARPGVLIYNQRWKVDEIVALPVAWNSTGWVITIAHGGQTEKAAPVDYAVYPM
jgi:hypothetical protein